MQRNYSRKIIGDGKYRLIRLIDTGSLGDIYLGKNVHSGEDVAVKIENVESSHQRLRCEYKIYRELGEGIGLPRICCYGKETKFNFMVMTLLGPSLEKLFNSCSRHFTIKTVLMLAIQMIDLLSRVHSRSYIHGDIKPENFLMGTGKYCYRLFLIDFGSSKKFKNQFGHIFCNENQDLSGTARYASINWHKRIVQTRRDDAESLGYLLMYLNRGNLPWQKLKATNNQGKYELIAEKKMSTPVEVLCEGFPEEFAMYINYCRSLQFRDRPDYMYMRQLFRNLFKKLNYKFDNIYDWTLLNESEDKDEKIKEVTKDFKDLVVT